MKLCRGQNPDQEYGSEHFHRAEWELSQNESYADLINDIEEMLMAICSRSRDKYCI